MQEIVVRVFPGKRQRPAYDAYGTLIRLGSAMLAFGLWAGIIVGITALLHLA